MVDDLTDLGARLRASVTTASDLPAIDAARVAASYG